MSQAPAMPLFCGDYLGDTMHLSLEEHGAYLKLLMITWRNGGQPLPDDDKRIARMLGVTVARWTDKLRPVIAEFFDLSGGMWRSERLEKEWKFVEERAANSRANGAQGGRPKSPKTNETENPSGSFQATQKEPTQPQPHTGEREAVASLPPIPPKAQSRKGTRLPADWVLPDDYRAYAQDLGLTGIDRIAEDFRDYWCARAGPKGVMLDWLATWRSWCRRELDKQKRNSGYGGRQQQNKPTSDGRETQRRADIVRLLNLDLEPGGDGSGTGPAAAAGGYR